jgi:DNA-directed RNA polymerases I and III subunit RPAC2
MALIWSLSCSPDVDFCGYTIPHPSEPKMHVRLQTRAGVSSDDALRQGVTDLRKVSSTIADAYRKELKAFNRRQKKN